MEAIKLKLHWKQENRIRELLKYEERRVIRRCNILSCLHNGMTSGMIASVLHVDPKTVRNVAKVFLESGLDQALFDEERSGRPIDVDDKERSRIVAMVCSEPPKGTSRWTLDLIADEAINRGLIRRKISKELVRIILQQHSLKPWQEKMWCIGELDEIYIERMEDILDVYEREFDPTKPVVCIDEKPIQILSSKTKDIAAKEGSVRKVDYEYKREGTANVVVAVEPKAGVYFHKATKQRCGIDFAEFVTDLVSHYSSAEKIILVMDNLSTHSQKSLTDALDEPIAKAIWDRFEVHYTPVHASWLNQAEIAIGMYSRGCLGTKKVESIDNLRGITAAWDKRANEKAVKIQWRFTKSKARKSLRYDVDREKLS